MEPVTEQESLLFVLGTSLAILILIVCSGIFSGSETALTTANRAKLHAQSEKGEGRALRALRLMDDKERLIGSILLGNNLVNILATSLATLLFSALLGDGGVIVATLVMTTLVLIFAEVLPKTYAITNAERLSQRVAGIISFAVRVFSPIVGAVQLLVRFILRLVGVQTIAERNTFAAHEEIAGAISLHHFEGAVEKADHDRLLGVLDLAQRTVEEVMTHRSDMQMIDADASTEEIIRQVLSSQHTRLPLYRGDTENIIGIIHAKDLSRAIQNCVLESGGASLVIDVPALAMDPYFVPEVTRLDDQMHAFLKQKTHIALVIDEYGSLQGLVTLEDIIEEIIGEIADEHDIDADLSTHAGDDGSIDIDGDMTIRDLNRHYKISLSDDNAVTVAGFVINGVRRIPIAGEVIDLEGLRFEVLEKEFNRLTRLRIHSL
jgi:Mg2+/Co2+ transporter CorB